MSHPDKGRTLGASLERRNQVLFAALGSSERTTLRNGEKWVGWCVSLHGAELFTQDPPRLGPSMVMSIFPRGWGGPWTGQCPWGWGWPRPAHVGPSPAPVWLLGCNPRVLLEYVTGLAGPGWGEAGWAQAPAGPAGSCSTFPNSPQEHLCPGPPAGAPALCLGLGAISLPPHAHS